MARTSSSTEIEPVVEQPAPEPGPLDRPARVPATPPPPAPSPRSVPRHTAPKPLVDGDVVRYGANTYPIADAVQLGLIPPTS